MGNSAELNRKRIWRDTATVTTGMKKTGLGIANKYVVGTDKPVRLWPCKKDHPPHRVKWSQSRKALVCLECEQIEAQERRDNATR